MVDCVIDYTIEEKQVYNNIINNIVKKYNINNYKIKYFIRSYQDNLNKYKELYKVYLYTNNKDLLSINYNFNKVAYLGINCSKYYKDYNYFYEFILSDKEVAILYNNIK